MSEGVARIATSDPPDRIWGICIQEPLLTGRRNPIDVRLEGDSLLTWRFAYPWGKCQLASSANPEPVTDVIASEP